MAGEITISLSVVGSKNGATASATDSDVIDMAGNNISSQTVTVGTVSGAIPIGATTVGGIMAIKNLSTTGTIWVDNVAAVVANAPIKIKYGETALFRTATGTYYAIADIASLIQIVCFDA